MAAQGQLKPLSRFQWTPHSEDQHLFADLWPTSKRKSVSLDGRIQFLTPDDRWLNFTDSNDIHEDEGKGEGEGGDPNDSADSIRLIDLKAYPHLVIFSLRFLVMEHGDHAAFVVRHEYDVFLRHAMSRATKGPQLNRTTRFFVTGQPGVGK
jgi:hypothetical protein